MNTKSCVEERTLLHSLPGFMGEPSDWKAVIAGLEAVEHRACGLYDSGLPAPAAGLWAWAEAFNALAAAARGRTTPRRHILVGYSLGGRLALHALCLEPRLWDGAIIVSANAGLDSAADRRQRHADDILWARRLLTEPWDAFLQAWNGRTAFKNDSLCLLRREDDCDKELLAATLTHWSLGRQDDLSKPLEQLYLPILWVAGAEDRTYALAARRQGLRHPQSRVWIAPGAGHRVPWCCCEGFVARCREFLKQEAGGRRQEAGGRMREATAERSLSR